jgi:hypothetical protein
MMIIMKTEHIAVMTNLFIRNQKLTKVNLLVIFANPYLPVSESHIQSIYTIIKGNTNRKCRLVCDVRDAMCVVC